MWHTIKKWNLLFVAILFVYAVAITANVLPRMIAEKNAPGSTQYGFPNPWLADYFQYVSMIKSGAKGQLFFDNQYSEEFFPKLLLQPQYNIIGIITKPMGIDPFTAFSLFSFLGLMGLITTVIWFTNALLPTIKGKAMALFFFITASNIWYRYLYNGKMLFGDPETYSHWFNIFPKLTMLPFHHYVAVSLFIILIYRFLHLKNTPKALLINTVLTLLLTFLHPYIGMALMYILVFYAITTMLLQRKFDFVRVMHTGVCGIAAVSMLLYYRYLIVSVWGGTSISETTTGWAPPLVTLQNYLLALGPLLIPAALFAIQPKSITSFKWRLLTIWSFLPIAIYFIPNIGIPSGGLRIFQVYQQIPLALLAGLLIDQIAQKLSKIQPIVFLLPIIGILLYVTPQFFAEVDQYSSLSSPYFYTYNLLTLSKPAFSFLQLNTPSRSVVLAGEMLSMMIPSFTENRVIVGHGGDNRNYEQKLVAVRTFFSGYIPVANAKDFLKAYNVDYIVWGLDSGGFEGSPYYKLPFLQEVMNENGIVITKVLKS